MKTKFYKTYSRAAKVATTESIFIEHTNVQMFAHRGELLDTNVDVIERAFSWIAGSAPRVFRVFKLRNGDYALRCHEGFVNDNIAERVFSDKKSAVDYLNILADGYAADSESSESRGWKEVYYKKPESL